MIESLNVFGVNDERCLNHIRLNLRLILIIDMSHTSNIFSADPRSAAIALFFIITFF
jgi:hypothetical protein